MTEPYDLVVSVRDQRVRVRRNLRPSTGIALSSSRKTGPAGR
jgi:hypothetical protein